MVEGKDIKREIFRKFVYKQKLKYNEIWDKKLCASSLFDYHLKKIIDEGMIEKKDEFYVLTNKGFEYVGNLDGKKIEKVKKPLLCSFFIVRRGEKFLMCKRAKQPFIDFLGLAGGKVDFGNTTSQQADIELFEETGLKGESKLSRIGEFITRDYNTNEIVAHMIGFFYYFENVEGELNPDTREGEFMWLGVNDINNYKVFPELEFGLRLDLEENNYIKHYLSERVMDGEDIVEVDSKITEFN